MTWGNQYLIVRKPFQYWTPVGTEPSNVWIGRSNMLNTICAAMESWEGQVFHDLVGGLYADGGDEPGHRAMWLPMPPATLHDDGYRHKCQKRFQDLMNAGALELTTEPTERPNYANWNHPI